MLNNSTFLSYTETHDFFQTDLFLLLASLIVSLLLSSALPYFCVSALCFLITLGSLTFELLSGPNGYFTHLETTTILALAVIFSVTFIYTLVRRRSTQEVRWHAATALALSAFLALKAVWIMEVAAQPNDVVVSYVMITSYLSFLTLCTGRSLYS